MANALIPNGGDDRVQRGCEPLAVRVPPAVEVKLGLTADADREGVAVVLLRD